MFVLKWNKVYMFNICIRYNWPTDCSVLTLTWLSVIFLVTATSQEITGKLLPIPIPSVGDVLYVAADCQPFFVACRWAGAWGIEADFIAKTKCSIMCIKAEDLQVQSSDSNFLVILNARERERVCARVSQGEGREDLQFRSTKLLKSVLTISILCSGS